MAKKRVPTEKEIAKFQSDEREGEHLIKNVVKAKERTDKDALR